VRHREDLKGLDRERQALSTIAMPRGNLPLACGFVAWKARAGRQLSATDRDPKRAQSELSRTGMASRVAADRSESATSGTQVQLVDDI
jgi:hypothetical protein